MRGRGGSGYGVKKGTVALSGDKANMMRLHVEMHKVNGAQLAVFSMFLDRKFSGAEYVGCFVRVVLVMKESCSNLGEQKAGR